MLDTDEDWDDATDCSGVVSRSSVCRSEAEDPVSVAEHTDTSGLSCSTRPKETVRSSVNEVLIKGVLGVSILKQVSIII